MPCLLDCAYFCKSHFCTVEGILKALSRKLDLDKDINLDFISARTQHYSGADLKGLLNDAQLLVVHQSLSTNKERGKLSSNKLENPANGYVNKIQHETHFFNDGQNLENKEGKLLIQQHHLEQVTK